MAMLFCQRSGSGRQREQKKCICIFDLGAAQQHQKMPVVPEKRQLEDHVHAALGAQFWSQGVENSR